MSKITEMLIKNGHSRIAGIFKYDDIQGIERYKGFIECLSDYGIKFDDDCIRWYSTKDTEEKLSTKGFLRMQRRIKEYKSKSLSFLWENKGLPVVYRCREDNQSFSLSKFLQLTYK